MGAPAGVAVLQPHNSCQLSTALEKRPTERKPTCRDHRLPLPSWRHLLWPRGCGDRLPLPSWRHLLWPRGCGDRLPLPSCSHLLWPWDCGHRLWSPGLRPPAVVTGRLSPCGPGCGHGRAASGCDHRLWSRGGGHRLWLPSYGYRTGAIGGYRAVAVGLHRWEPGAATPGQPRSARSGS
ncbi:hypothetical protein GCM10017786_44300 [Amycolatopsis deserti]|uniref:Uncharacterized protein n=1 Tax=Amycolatopsis deserti TaxID=185696 RepID=A0ABQ3JB32_9PSEU|nr:hypothetical protein GCM10017786_44300 [Amycolatopsis deserti]